MNFTIKPENPKNTVIMAVVLVGVLIWIAGMEGGKSKKGAAPAGGAVAEAATMDLSVLIGAGTATGPVDTTFGANPFLDVAAEPEEFEEDPELPEPENRTLTLQGTVVNAGQTLALISGLYLSPGQEVQGWRLVWVAPREARLVRGDQTLTLRMDQ